MRKFLIASCLLGAAGAAVFWLLTMPRTIAAGDLPDHDGDPVRGEYVFHAAGCASCHAAPGAKGDDKLRLAGGLGLKSPFGTIVAPNISPDPIHGIGGWTTLAFVNAVMRGVSPEGRHYYPAFPYMSYQRMTLGDVLDLKAFIDTLPAVATDAPAHDLSVLLGWRRGLGLWKALFMDYAPFSPAPGADERLNRGAYLVTGPGHCGECHTPRNLLGGPQAEWAFSGGPAPKGKDFIPNITPHEDGIGGWSADDIAVALETGLLPDFETFGGVMTEVQENMEKLTAGDREAIAVYLKSLPPRPSRWKQ
ncbi:MAG: c-type cytochrome [Alphaproteobacteria bacterium]